MSEIDSKPFPQAALIGAAALIGVTLVLTGGVSAGLIAKPKDAADRRAESAMPARAVIMLGFADAPGGALTITDLERGTIVRTIEPGEASGFIRGVLRSFARERRMLKSASQDGFKLVLWANGSLSLTDQQTGRTVELDSFGADNRAAFLALLPKAEVASR